MPQPAEQSEDTRNADGSVQFLEEGFQVCGEAADGLEAIEKAETWKPELITLDSGPCDASIKWRGSSFNSRS